MTYNRINGEDIEFVDEDGNVIVGGEETVVYVNRKGKVIETKRAKKALNSGQYIDSRSLYDDRYGPKGKKKEERHHHHHSQQQKPQTTRQRNEFVYRPPSTNHTTEDLIANMNKVFAEAKKNLRNVPDISMIESDARSNSFHEPNKQRQEQLRLEKLRETIEQERIKKQKEYEKQMERDRIKQQRQYEKQIEESRTRQQREFQKQAEQQQREIKKMIEKQQREYRKQLELQQKEAAAREAAAEAKIKEKEESIDKILAAHVASKPPINYQVSSSKNQLNPKFKGVSPKRQAKPRSASSKNLPNNPYAHLQNQYHLPSSGNNPSNLKLNNRNNNESFQNLQKMFSNLSLAHGRDRSLQPTNPVNNMSSNHIPSYYSSADLYKGYDKTLQPLYDLQIQQQQQHQQQQQMFYQQQQQQQQQMNMYNSFGDYGGYQDYGYDY